MLYNRTYIQMTKETYKIIYGGWYQRTVLHLDEIEEFFTDGTSELDLPEDDLKKLWRALRIENVERRSGYMDYVQAETEGGMKIRYYEDGLYTLETESQDISEAKKTIEDYCGDRLNPAVSYIFSLGAPTSHKLIQSREHPMVVIKEVPDLKKFEFPPEKFGKALIVLNSEDVKVYKIREGFFVVLSEKSKDLGRNLAELHIFLREFQNHLYAYLSLHRQVWESIMEVKNQKVIRGTEADEVRARLESHERLVNVVNNRINQMDIFAGSRGGFVNSLRLGEQVQKYFSFKFNTLRDTLSYIDHMWKGTQENLRSAIEGVMEVKRQSSFQGLRSLQFIMSIGVIAGIIGYMTESELPQVTSKGALYFLGIILLTWFVNGLVNRFYLSRKYKINMEGK